MRRENFVRALAEGRALRALGSLWLPLRQDCFPLVIVGCLASALPAFLFFGCGRQDHGATASALTLAGSTSVQPFAEKLADVYMDLHPGILINVQGGGSTAGVQAVKEGVAQIGMCSRPLKKDEEDLTAVVIARDGLAIIVHPSNPISGLSIAQIRGLFSGAIGNWQEVGGPDKVVRIITREDGSGTRGAFQELIMKETEIANDALVQDSNGAVREVVAGDPNIVGYISLGLVDHRVKAVAVDGVPATEQQIVENRYHLVRPFLFLSRGAASEGEPKRRGGSWPPWGAKGPPSAAPQGAPGAPLRKGLAAQFVEFVLSAEGQKLLTQEGLVPAGQ